MPNAILLILRPRPGRVAVPEGGACGRHAVRRTRAGAFCVVFADNLGWAVIVPVLPYYAERLGAGPAGVGLLISVYALAQAVAAPLLGRLADRVGRKRVLVACLAGSCLSFLGLAAARSFAMVLGSRVLDGVTAGNLPVAHAVVADATPEPERAAAFNMLAMAYGAAFLLGPLAAAAALRAGPRAPVLAGAGFSALSVALAAFLLPGGKGRPASRGAGGRGSLARGCAGSLAAMACLFAAYQLFTSGFPLFAERACRPGGHGFGARELSLVYALVGATALGVQGLLSGPMIRRLGERGATALAFAAGALGAAVLGLGRGWPGILGPVVLCAAGLAVLRPLLAARLSREAGPGRQGAAMGLAQTVQSAMQILAPLAAGGLIGLGRLGTWRWLLAGCLAAGLAWVLGRSEEAPGQGGGGQEAVEPVQETALAGQER